MSWGQEQPPPYESADPYGQPPQQPYSAPGASSPPPDYSQPDYAPPAYPQPGFPPSDYPQPGYAQQPAYSQPGFPQPAYPPSDYPQPGFGQPDFTGPGFPETPRKKGNGLLVGVVAGALVVAAGGITAAVLLTGGHGGSPAPDAAAAALSAPADVRGLTKLTGSVADAAVGGMRQSLSAEAAQYPDPLLAAYDDRGGPGVTTILVDEPMGKLSAADQSGLTSLGSASDIVSSIMSDAGVLAPQQEPTTAADGALSCGTKDESSTDVTICVWYDGATFGSLQYLDGTSPAAAAPVADAVRAAAEGR